MEANTTVYDFLCNSQDSLVKLNYMWNIFNFNLHFEETSAESLESDKFPAITTSGVTWRLTINRKNLNEYAVYLTLIECRNDGVRAKYSCYLCNSQGEKTINLINDKYIRFTSNGSSQETLFRLTEGDDLLSENTLKIFCELSYVQTQQQLKTIVIPQFAYKNELSQHLSNLLENGKFCDVSLIVGNHEYKAHKTMLAARSSVFAAMFDHQMEENTTNRVTITDVDHKVVEEMLAFIYSDKAPNLQKMPFDLFKVADKYDLKKLKEMCEQELYLKLCKETAVKTLILADLHNALKLKKYTIDFINDNAVDIIGSECWQDKDISHFISDMYEALAVPTLSEEPPAKRQKLTEIGEPA